MRSVTGMAFSRSSRRVPFDTVDGFDRGTALAGAPCRAGVQVNAVKLDRLALRACASCRGFDGFLQLGTVPRMPSRASAAFIPSTIRLALPTRVGRSRLGSLRHPPAPASGLPPFCCDHAHQAAS